MSIKQLAAELVFLPDSELAKLAEYLVKNYPNTADRLDQDLYVAFQEKFHKDQEVFSPYLGA